MDMIITLDIKSREVLFFPKFKEFRIVFKALQFELLYNDHIPNERHRVIYTFETPYIEKYKRGEQQLTLPKLNDFCTILCKKWTVPEKNISFLWHDDEGKPFGTFEIGNIFKYLDDAATVHFDMNIFLEVKEYLEKKMQGR